MESGNRFRRASKVEAAPTSLFSIQPLTANPCQQQMAIDKKLHTRGRRHFDMYNAHRRSRDQEAAHSRAVSVFSNTPFCA